MKGEKIFREYYAPQLSAKYVDNVVLRVYDYIPELPMKEQIDGHATLIFSPLGEVEERIEKIFTETGESRGIGLTSIVSVRSMQKFLFLLDCSLPVCDESEEELLKIFRNSDDILPGVKSGMALRTKNSYHIAGFVPLDRQSWYEHMAHAILLKTEKGAPVADTRAVGYNISRGYGTLRINDYKEKPTPDFICFL